MTDLEDREVCEFLKEVGLVRDKPSKGSFGKSLTRVLLWGGGGLLVVFLTNGILVLWQFVPPAVAVMSALIGGVFLGYGMAGEDVTMLPEMMKDTLPRLAISLASTV